MTYPRKVMDLARRIGDQSKDNAGAKLSAMTVLTGRTPAANAARMKLARTLAKKHKMTPDEIAKAIDRSVVVVRGYLDPAFKKMRDFHNSRKHRAKLAAKKSKRKGKAARKKVAVKKKAAKKSAKKAKRRDAYAKAAKVVKKAVKKTTARKVGKNPALAAPYGKAAAKKAARPKKPKAAKPKSVDPLSTPVKDDEPTQAAGTPAASDPLAT